MEKTPLPVAAYGQACVTCARAKCRCVPRSSGSACQRCHRLSKECRPSVRVRKPKPLSKTAQLEQKVDGLMYLLNKKSADSTSATPVPAGGGQALPEPVCNEAASTSARRLQHHPLPIVTVNEEEDFLHVFRTEKLQFFPFVHIPPGKSVQQLKRESPFLWRCITAVQTRDCARQTELVINLRRAAGEKLLVDCQKNLDLLQGLLVYLAWITYQSQPQKSSLCVYTNLAIAVVVELGLNKPPPRDANIVVRADELPHLRQPSSPVRTMDERRAVLCCFILRRMDPLRWTPHLAECLETLAQSPEWEGDAVLVQMTRIRVIAEKIVQCSASDFPQAPLSFHLEAIRLQFEDLKTRIPPDLVANNTVLLHLLHTDVTLYAMALTKPHLVPDNAGVDADPKLLDHLYTCLVAVKKFFDVFVTLPPATYASFSATHLCQTAHSFTTLFRLSILECPGWDRAAVRNIADIMVIAEQVNQRLRQASEATSMRNIQQQQPSDSFIALATAVSKLRAGWASRLEVADLETASVGGDMNLGGGAVPDLAFLETDHQWDLDSFLGWSENAWLPDATMPGEYDFGRY